MSISEEIIALQKELSLFDNWLDRYQYLIDIGKQLPTFPAQYQTKTYLLAGCQSNVWFKLDLIDQRIEIKAYSDAMIVAGLIAVLIRLFNHRTLKEVLSAPKNLFEQLQISQHLSMTRRNGLYAMLNHVYKLSEMYANTSLVARED